MLNWIKENVVKIIIGLVLTIVTFGLIRKFKD